MRDRNDEDLHALAQLRPGMFTNTTPTEPFGHPDVSIPPKPKRAPELLESGAATYRERNKLYGDNYHHFGQLMMGLFPHGITVNEHTDWNRLALIINCAGKLQRYTQSFARGGHQDSAHDLMVYAAMLEELTRG